jgi:hypothetical protein
VYLLNSSRNACLNGLWSMTSIGWKTEVQFAGMKSKCI